MKHVLGAFIVIGLLVGLIPPLPVQAEQQDVVLSHILAGVSGGATHEFIALRNTSQLYVDITDWCLYNKNDIPIVCIQGDSPTENVEIPPDGMATLASESFVSAYPEVAVGWVFEPISASSGSLVGSNDVLTVRTPDGVGIDTHSWSSTIASGSWLVRSTDAETWDVALIDEFPLDTTARYTFLIDYCGNIDGIQDNLPDNMTYDEQGDCVEYYAPLLPALYITELMINPSGIDNGMEWIELWNAGAEPVSLENMYVELGVDTTQLVALDPSVTLQPGEYYVLTQPAYDFTLTNTTSRARLVTGEGLHVFTSDTYVTAKDDQSWALFEDGWRYTSTPTPGAPNELPAILPVTTDPQITTLKPCRADQYRSTETNRCRLIPQSSTPAPCKEGQYRSAETNRCRNIAVAATPTPCKEDQERNPETGRCRKIRELITAEYEVLGAQNEQRPQQWYGIAVIGVVVLGLVGYGAWEWRHELGRFLRSVWARLAGGSK